MPPAAVDVEVADVPTVAPAPEPGRTRSNRVRELVALGVAVALVVVASRWGEALLADGLRMKINTPPLRGPFEWRPGRSGLAAAVLAAAVVFGWSSVADRLRWRWLLGAAGATAIAWALALALIDGVAAITDPLVAPGQYLNTISRVGDLGTFLSTFSDRLADYNIHTQGHPPGMVVLLWMFDRVGLGGANWNAALVFAGGGVSVIATLVAARDVAGEVIARRAAPFLALMPAAIWWSSGDAFFAAVGAVAVTTAILATSTEGRRSDAYAITGGVAFAATAYLSYGLVLLGTIPVAVAITRRRLRPIVVVALTVVVLVVVVTVATGFAWWEGLEATRQRYFAGVASFRPYDFFLVANVAAFVIMIGPAAVAGLARRPIPRELFALLVGALGAVLLADLSGMSRAEVERIWIPFVPWVMLATGVALASRRSRRVWLGAQAAVTLVVAVAIRSPW